MARSPKVPAGFSGGLPEGAEMMQSPSSTPRQPLPCWLSMRGAGGGRTKIALIKLRVWKLFLPLGSGQQFRCAGLGFSWESRVHACWGCLDSAASDNKI